ncbi:hypothetical protein Ciccas_000327 [Cichlidogyrus casuarinus]|uniref:Uncharacterized protein n=1 Tax=Cichlidogyrus casuarinus TaxID=1844966 RepID=A0ABD2QNJ2_9PLAT
MHFSRVVVIDPLQFDTCTYQQILRRHCFPLKLIFGDLMISNNQRYAIPTANYAFTREKIHATFMPVQFNISELKVLIKQIANSATVALKFFSFAQDGKFSFENLPSIQIDSKDGSYETTNGYVYMTDTLIYSNNDLTRDLCSVSACKV